MGLGSLHPGREGKARQWREGWGGRLGNGWERKGGEGEEISIHGFKLVSPPMAGARSNSVRMPFLPPPMTHGYQRDWTQARWAQIRHVNHRTTAAP